jgi:hypothetical protein
MVFNAFTKNVRKGIYEHFMSIETCLISDDSILKMEGLVLSFAYRREREVP